jgi:signal transduction histidine kinase
VAGLAVPHLADWCAVNLYDENWTVHEVAVAHIDPAKVELARELQDRYPPRPEILAEEALPWQQGQSQLIPEVTDEILKASARDDEHYQLLQSLNIHSALVVPLVARERVLGLMVFCWAESNNRYDEQDLSLAEELARRAALALDNARLYAAERRARAEAEAAQQSLVLLAEARERNRLARELHDNVAQALGYLNLKLTTTHELLTTQQTPAALDNLQELKQIVGEAYTDIRGEIFNLRAGPTTEVDFLETLWEYVDKYRRFYQLEIELVFETETARFDLPAEVAAALVRTVQEALMNVRKHAGVNEACLRLGYEAGEVRIKVEDKGQGFNLAQNKATSYGLSIMKERMASIGGRVEIESAPGQGTRITLFYQTHSA